MLVKTKKILCIICACVCLVSSFVLPSSALEVVSSKDLNVSVTNVTDDTARYWFVSSTLTGSDKKNDFVFSSGLNGSYVFDFSNYDFVQLDNVSPDPENQWIAMQLSVDVSSQIIPGDLLDFDAVRFDIQWNLDSTNQVIDMDIFNSYISTLLYDMGASWSSTHSNWDKYVGFPRLGSYGGIDLNSLYGSHFLPNDFFDGKVYRNRYEFDAEHMEEFLTSPFIINLPYGLFCGDICTLSLTMELVKYGSSSTPDTPDVPDEPDVPGSNITQEDLDAAYNKGYNNGLNDGQDKNYVFGFVNGMWSGLLNFYNILANGISIGGITLGNIITSIIVITVLAIIIKKVI